MCGISGIFYFSKIDNNLRNQLKKMNQIQKHRGPDSSGIWISKSKKIGFGHTRLSILDLTKKSNQPFVDKTKSFVLTFNGEIYNFNEIKSILIKNGYEFKTKNSDTEVLINAYKKWGIRCIDYFRGMFAFAIWDSVKKKIFLVRDRVGVKPLYYKIDSEKIIFASEIKAILLDQNYEPEIDEESMYHYLSFLCTPAPNTMFKKIKKIEAGTWISVDEKGGLKKKCYWDSLNIKKKPGLDEEKKFKNNIYNLLVESVELRGIADVEVGVFLSGGIDSSTNAYLFSKNSSRKIKTFSIGYDKNYKSYKSELAFARIVANDIQSDHYEKSLKKKDLVKIISKMIYHQDEPISDPVCFPIFYLSELARKKGLKVCQVGEGADELFFGYVNWKRTTQINKMINNFLFPDIMKKIIVNFLKYFNLDYKYSADLIRRSLEKRPIFWGGAEAFTSFEKKKLLSENFKRKFPNLDSWNCIKHHHNFFKKKAKNKNIENWMTYIDLKIRLPELILMRIDKMTMSSSLEARVPFLDHKLVENMIDIPKDRKFKNGTLKLLLKQIVKKILPKEIINRKKQGFGLPLRDWFIDGLGIDVKAIISEFSDSTNFFNKKTLDEILNREGDTRVWYLLNLAIWWKTFIKKQSYFS